MKFSQEVQAVLRRQGWSPERRLDISEWMTELVASGFHILPEARSILENFGGLRIIPEKTPRDAYAAETIWFDPVTDVLSEVDRIKGWEDTLQMGLTPLGVRYPSLSIMLIAENGQVICEWGSIFAASGVSFEDAMENSLVFARRKSVIYGIDQHGNLFVDT
ncbi:hypothetical protein GC163_00210 [bacterium]|nr:hypothetical protein [bacterium]